MIDVKVVCASNIEALNNYIEVHKINEKNIINIQIGHSPTLNMDKYTIFIQTNK